MAGPHPVARAVPALVVVLLGRVLDGDLRRVRPQVSAGVGSGGSEWPLSIYRNIYRDFPDDFNDFSSVTAFSGKLGFV